MKFVRLIVLSIAVWGLLGAFNVSYAFSDLSLGDENFKEVEFLRELGVVAGYPDGSFRPDVFLNRAELTKIVVEAQGIDLVDDLNCFPDVKEGDWFAPYVCTALNRGIIAGYPDGTFRPANTINRAEMTKIVAEAIGVNRSERRVYADVPSDKWYSGYVEDMLGANLLSFDTLFEAGREVSRSDFVNVYYRYLNSGSSGVYGDSLDNVLLDFSIPREMMLNEIFVISGISLEDDQLIEVDFGNGNFSSKRVGMGERFQVTMVFFNEGTYTLKIGGEAFEISVVEDFVVDESFAKIDSLQAESFVAPSFKGKNYEDLFIVLNANVNSKDLIFEYEFDFGDESVRFYNRQMRDSLIIDSDLVSEKWDDQENISYKFSVANFASTKRGKFVELIESDILVVPQFETKYNNLEFVEFDFVYGEDDPVDIVFQPNKDVSQLLLVMDDDFQIFDVEGVVNKIDDSWRLRYLPEIENKFLILEVNDNEGRALVNYPVYRRNVLPLMEDPFFVGKDDFVEVNVENALLILNEDRIEFGLEPLVLDDRLSQLAESHLEDMLENEFVAHEGSDGRLVDTRKLDFGINSFVSENIARDLDLASAQSALMRSAAHRVNILSGSWDKVGIAVFFDADKGVTYLVQNFGIDEMLIGGFLDQTIEDSLNVEKDDRLKEIVDEWVNVMKDNSSSDKEINGESLIDKVSELGIYSNGATIIGSDFVLDEAQGLVKENLGQIDVNDFDKYFTASVLGDDGVIYYAVVLVK